MDETEHTFTEPNTKHIENSSRIVRNPKWENVGTTYHPSSTTTFRLKEKEKENSYTVEGKYAIGSEFKAFVESNIPVSVLASAVKFLVECVGLEEKFADTDPEKSEVASRLVTRLLIPHNADLYRKVLSELPVEEIPYLLWVHFNMDSDWYAVSGPTFRDMPTAVLERFFAEHWEERQITAPVADIKPFITARTDKYGVPMKKFFNLMGITN
jgi:hypothetical protein